MATTVQSILNAISAGVAIFKEVEPAVEGVLPPQAQVAVAVGTEIVQAASSLYTAVQTDLTANDQASVEAALNAAQTQTGIDLARVEAEIAADAAKP